MLKPALVEWPADGSMLFDGTGGVVGRLEVVFDRPAGVPRGIAVVTHPHPLQGGHAGHKIPAFLARALRDDGWVVARPNFRGVGATTGAHDEGEGEAEDVLALVSALRGVDTALPLALVGFSFGAFVHAKVAAALVARGEPAHRVSLLGMPYGPVHAGRAYDPPGGFPDAQVIHGEQDDRVPLSAVLAWARPHWQPVTVVPGADHFFAGRLPLLRRLVRGHLGA